MAAAARAMKEFFGTLLADLSRCCRLFVFACIHGGPLATMAEPKVFRATFPVTANHILRTLYAMMTSRSKFHNEIQKFRKTLELMWSAGEPSSKGARARLTNERIVSSTIKLLARDGLDKLSMRTLASHLNVGVMTLYNYVADKSQLVELAVERALATYSLDTGRCLTLSSVVRAMAQSNLELIRRFPWLLKVSDVRPHLGPNTLRKYEHELAALDRFSIPDIEKDAVVNLVVHFVEGIVRKEQEQRFIIAETSCTDAQWWSLIGPTLQGLINPEAYPVSSRVGKSVGEAFNSPYSSDHSYEFGLSILVHGIVSKYAT